MKVDQADGITIGEEILAASADEIVARTRLIDNECKVRR